MPKYSRLIHVSPDFRIHRHPWRNQSNQSGIQRAAGPPGAGGGLPLAEWISPISPPKPGKGLDKVDEKASNKEVLKNDREVTYP